MEGAGGDRFQAKIEKGLSPSPRLLIWRPRPPSIPARTLCAVALTPIDTDDEHRDEFGAAEGGRAHARALELGSVLGEHVQQELRNANEVDNLCDAEERSNDQGSAVRPFQESHGPLLLPDLPGERQHRQVSVHPTPPPRQESLWPCPWLSASLQRLLLPGTASTADQPPSSMCSANDHVGTSGQEQDCLPGTG